MNEKKLINLQLNEVFVGRLVLTESSIRKTKGTPPRNYLAVTLADSTGNISGNIWNYTSDEPMRPGVYDVRFTVGEYQGKKQCNNISLNLSSDQSTNEFSLQFTDEEHIANAVRDLCAISDAISNKALWAFAQELFVQRVDAWAQASSAVGMHHVGIGGNVIHTLEVVRIAIAASRAANEVGYANYTDLVAVGALLHDIGKLETYAVEGPACHMTDDGAMLDHIALGMQMLWASNAAQMYPDAAKLLAHIIASHHGKLEYGCTVTPKCIEAQIVCAADGMSATLAAYKEAEAKAMAEKREGNLTERVFAVNNTALLRRYYVTQLMGYTAE